MRIRVRTRLLLRRYTRLPLGKGSSHWITITMNPRSRRARGVDNSSFSLPSITRSSNSESQLDSFLCQCFRYTNRLESHPIMTGKSNPSLSCNFIAYPIRNDPITHIHRKNRRGNCLISPSISTYLLLLCTCTWPLVHFCLLLYLYGALFCYLGHSCLARLFFFSRHTWALRRI